MLSLMIILFSAAFLLGAIVSVRFGRYETSWAMPVLERSPNPACSDLAERVKSQRAKNLYFPNEHAKLTCKIGMVPTLNGYQYWNVDKPCNAFYTEQQCSVRNRPKLDNVLVKSFKLLPDGGPCVEPALSMADCDKLKEAISQYDRAQAQGNAWEKLAAMYHLAELIDGMSARAKAEWMFLPSHKVAVEKLTASLEERISLELDREQDAVSFYTTIAYNLGPLWRVLLRYCAGAESRYLQVNKHSVHPQDIEEVEAMAAAAGRQDCAEVTKMNELGVYHPVGKLSTENFQSIKTLFDFQNYGLSYVMQEDVWKQLTTWAQVLNRDSAREKILNIFSNLIQTGRSPQELELALQMLQMHGAEFFSGGPPPEAGARRLKELQVLARLRIMAAQEGAEWDTVNVEKLIEDASTLLREELQWVKVEEVQALKEKVKDRFYAAEDEEAVETFKEEVTDRLNAEKIWQRQMCVAADLPLNCTWNEVYAVMDLRYNCDEANLPASMACTEEDLKTWIALKKKCEELGIDSCTQQMVDSEVMIAKCKAAHLPASMTCTEEDLKTWIALKRKCEELGIDSCTQQMVDLTEVMIAKCKAAHLPRGCTQDDLDKCHRSKGPRVGAVQLESAV